VRYIVVLFCFFAVITGLTLGGCKKDELDTDPNTRLSFSADTVYFDTIFVTLGSITKRFRVYNNSDKRIKISDIRLAGGSASPFRLNIDGMPVSQTSDLEIEAKDSIYIFAEVTIDPNSALLPFVIADSVLFNTNGNAQNVKLVAYGQNADFYRPTTFLGNGFPPFSVVECNTTWTNALPKVIIGYLAVDSGCTLTIEAGTRVHLYNNSGIWVYKGGTLIVNGTMADSVIFQGVREEDSYKEVPGQWDRIWINQGSTGNLINYAVIKNGNIGIQAENVLELGTDMPQKNLKLSNTRIRNMKAFGIYGVNYNIDAYNTVVSNCGSYGLALIFGGNYRFRHTTIANYWSESVRSVPCVFISNYKANADNSFIVAEMNFSFTNGIVYGNKQDDNEFELDKLDGADLNWKFTNTVLKVDNPDVDVNNASQFQNMKINQEPAFVDSPNQNYKLKAESSAIGAASVDSTNASPAISTDIFGVSWSTAPAAGAIEFVP